MFRTRVLSIAFVALGLSLSIATVSGAVIGTSAIRFYESRSVSPGTPPVFTSGIYKFTVPRVTNQQLGDPGLFTNQTIIPLQADGTILIATAASDPFFNTIVSRLTNGVSQTASHVYQWLPNSNSITSYGTDEAGLFALPAGTVDFHGKTIRSIGLQINFMDQFLYQGFDARLGATFPTRQYRFEATLLISDTETIDAPTLPVAVAMAARANAFRLQHGETLVLDASKSLGDITKYEWDLNRDGVFDITTVDPQISLSPSQYAPLLVPNRSRSMLLQVTDSAGNTSVSSSDLFTYVPEPSASVLSIAAFSFILRRKGRREVSISHETSRSTCEMS